MNQNHRWLSVIVFLFPSILNAAEWSQYGGDIGGQRFVADSLITPGNVSSLVPAWQMRTGDATAGEEYSGKASSFKATPVLFRGRLYISSGFNRVFALHPETGAVDWVHDPEVDFSRGYAEMFTSRGVSPWPEAERSAESQMMLLAEPGSEEAKPADATTAGSDSPPVAATAPAAPCAGRIFLGTLDARLIALDAATGKPCRDFGNNGAVDLSKGIAGFRRGEYAVTTPVLVAGDLVIAGSSIGDNGGVRMESGKVRAFDARDGSLRWEWDPIPRTPQAAGWDTWSDGSGRHTGAANVWSAMAADRELGLAILPTTSPSPDFYGGLRLGDNLHSNSVVALDLASGKRRWHFQTVRHDLWDYDLAAQPLLVDAGMPPRPAIVQATKMGFVFVLDRANGKPLFPLKARAVPASDVPGERSAPRQWFPSQPEPLHPTRPEEVKVWQYTEEHAAFCEGLLEGVRMEGIFTPPSLAGSLLYPGNAGGTNWGSMAAHPGKRLAVLGVNRLPTVVRLIPRKAFAAEARRGRNASPGVEFTAQAGTPYGMSRHTLWNPTTGYPCLEGPWSEWIALDLRDGSVRWRQPVGHFAGLEAHPQASRWGGLISGGPSVHAGGVVFVASERPAGLHALGLESGKILWTGALPAGAAATPMSYQVGTRQFVVVAAGGAQADGGRGDFLQAFVLETNTSRAGEE